MIAVQIQNRSIILQLIFTAVTLGIYGFYWYYSTLRQMNSANKGNVNAAFWSILLVVPIVNWFSYWAYAGEFTEFNGGRYPSLIVGLAWILYIPLILVLAQSELNRSSNFTRE